MYMRIVSLALKGIALAMSVTVILLNIFGSLAVGSALSMIGFGLAALALEALQKEEPGSVIRK